MVQDYRSLGWTSPGAPSVDTQNGADEVPSDPEVGWLATWPSVFGAETPGSDGPGGRGEGHTLGVETANERHSGTRPWEWNDSGAKR